MMTLYDKAVSLNAAMSRDVPLHAFVGMDESGPRLLVYTYGATPEHVVPETHMGVVVEHRVIGRTAPQGS